MSEGSRSERASPTGAIGYTYRTRSRPSRVGTDRVVGPRTDVRDDVVDGDRSQIGRLVPIRERTFRREPTDRGSQVCGRTRDGSGFSRSVYPMRSEAGFDHVTEVIASDDG